MNLDILNCVLVICMSVVLMVLNVWTCRREMYRDSYSWTEWEFRPMTVAALCALTLVLGMYLQRLLDLLL